MPRAKRKLPVGRPRGATGRTTLPDTVWCRVSPEIHASIERLCLRYRVPRGVLLRWIFDDLVSGVYVPPNRVTDDE